MHPNMHANTHPSPGVEPPSNHFYGPNDLLYTLQSLGSQMPDVLSILQAQDPSNNPTTELPPQSVPTQAQLMMPTDPSLSLETPIWSPLQTTTPHVSPAVEHPPVASNSLQFQPNAYWLPDGRQFQEPQGLQDGWIPAGASPTSIYPPLTLVQRPPPPSVMFTPQGLSMDRSTDHQGCIRRSRDINTYGFYPTRPCGWIDESGSKCGAPISASTCTEHLVQHGIMNRRSTDIVQCRWGGCMKNYKRRGVVRHVRERHLGVRRGTFPYKGN